MTQVTLIGEEHGKGEVSRFRRIGEKFSRIISISRIISATLAVDQVVREEAVDFMEV